LILLTEEGCGGRHQAPKPAPRLRVGLRQSTRSVVVVSSWVFTGGETTPRAGHWARRCPTTSGTGSSGRSISTRRMCKRHRWRRCMRRL